MIMKMLLILLPLLAATASAQTMTGDAVNGKRLSMRNGCYQCHGTVGQGGLAGPRLAQSKLSQAGFISYLRNPRPGNMPPYRAVLQEATGLPIFDITSLVRMVHDALERGLPPRPA